MILIFSATGCGSFVARRMAQAPNTYPTWFAPKARVALVFSDKFLTNFPARFIDVGPPPAQMRYRVVNPADYHVEVSPTNWFERGQQHFKFSFKATVPGETNAWTASPRGTVILLHGYGLGQFAMSPWALRLAEEGWRCVLVDLRGHGKSTGEQIYYGVKEARDLSELLDALETHGSLSLPVSVLGESYGAALALRWKTADPRVGRVVAIAPYGVLSNAVMNVCHEYARWLPRWLVNAGLRKLPSVLSIEPSELDTTTLLKRNPVMALFVAGTEDKIAPPAVVRELYNEAATGSEWVEVTNATHEALPYYFSDLVPPVLEWLGQENDLKKALN
jgi:cephalosporin-C deacetylase-like acetyl esterase